MLRSISSITGSVLQATDGEIGRCKDFLFDDEYWTIRFMVADTGKWLPGRRVLVSPVALERPDWPSKRFHVNLTKDQIREQPELDEHAPVSRQHEIRYHRHFSWAPYWGMGGLWGTAAAPPALAGGEPPALAADGDLVDKHLRSTAEVTGYSIEATDGEIGHVDEFIADDESWALRYLVVATRNWLPGKKVLLSPTWVREVRWADRHVALSLAREQVEKAPEYDPAMPVNREYEELLYDFYGRPKYWAHAAEKTGRAGTG